MEKPYSSSTYTNPNYGGNPNYQQNPSGIAYSSPPYPNQQNNPPPLYGQPQIYPPPNYPAYSPEYGGLSGVQYSGPPGVQYAGPQGVQYAGPPGMQYTGPQQAFVKTTPIIGDQSIVIIPVINGIAFVEYNDGDKKRAKFANRMRYLILGKLVADILLA